jgi:hypothetical protein
MKTDIFYADVVTAENFFRDENASIESLDDILYSITSAFKGIADFFSKAVNNGLTFAFDDLIRSGVDKELVKILRNIDSAEGVPFSSVKDKAIQVPAGLNTNLPEALEFVKNNIFQIIKDNDLLNRFEKDLAQFITDETFRTKSIVNLSKFKELEKRQIKVQKELESKLDLSKKTVSNIGILVGNFDGFKKAVTIAVDVLHKIDEKELKVWLADVANLNNRINKVIEIIETENVPEKNVKELAYALHTLANHVTILSKLYYLLYHSGTTLVAVNKDYKQD